MARRWREFRRTIRPPPLKGEVFANILRVTVGLLSFLAGGFFLISGLGIYIRWANALAEEKYLYRLDVAFPLVTLGIVLFIVTLLVIFVPTRKPRSRS